MTNYFNSYINNLIGEQKSKKTIKAYEIDVKQMLEHIGKDETEITYSDLLNWKASISSLSSASLARKITCVRGYFQFLEDIEVISINPARKLKSVKIVNKEKVPMTSEQMRALIDNAKNIRDRAIISLLCHSAMRISEVIGLNIADANKDCVTICGKGNKERKVYIDSETRQYISEYLSTRNCGCNKLFVSNQGTMMREECVSKMLKFTAKKTGLFDDISYIAPHLCRASCATLMAQNNVPIQVIQETLGHSSITTTTIYVKNNIEQIRSAMTTKMF